MVKLIVAIAENNAIGKDNDLLWHLPADMKFFTETTKGHVVIMGRRNWDSIPTKYQPLPNRENVIITRNSDYTNDQAKVFNDLKSAIDFYKNDVRDTFVIGGGQIYRLALEEDLVEEMLITIVHHEFEADTFFPDIDEEKWEAQLLAEHEADDKNEFAFDIYRFIKK